MPPEITITREGGTPLDPTQQLLTVISEQLAGLQASLDRMEKRLEQAAGEFGPPIRGLLSSRVARIAGRARPGGVW